MMPVLLHVLLRVLGSGLSPKTKTSEQAKARKIVMDNNTNSMLLVLRQGIICSLGVLLLSITSDRFYFGTWTFPPYHWLRFNISQDLAVFYGQNDWHYYLSQGLPLLLTSYLPFTLIALYHNLSNPRLLAPWYIPYLFTVVVCTTLASLSLISHKEVRFIYPLLPLLHIITAPHAYRFFCSPTRSEDKKSIPKAGFRWRRKPVVSLMLILNISIAFYTTRVHQAGVVPVMGYLRHEYAKIRDAKVPETASQTFAGFLMPCHSVPWRSQLFYPELKAWALTCEPPLELAAGTLERSAYRDEADRFYDDMPRFLSSEMGNSHRPWPRLIIGFQGIETPLRAWLESDSARLLSRRQLQERKRFANSQWHDDWRRTGDVVVWELS